MTDRLRKFLALALALALTASMLGLAGCGTKDEADGGGEPADQPVEGGTLAFYINQPAFIDPYNGQESEGIQVIQAVFDSLVTFDSLTSEIAPAAAERWESNDDASAWTFYLAEDATFHDGTPVTAADFKYAWERIANPENESEIAYHLGAIKGFGAMQDGEATELEGVKAVDDYTLEVTLEYPFADFQYVVGHPALAPVPQDAVENGVKYTKEDGTEETVDFADMPIGNGPFMMAEPWAADQYIKVERFDDYYGEMPYVDGVDFKIFKDEETAYLEFEAGNLDFTSVPSGQFAAALEKYGESGDGYTVEPGKQVVTGTQLAIYYMLCNQNDDLMKNKEFRQALSLAIDRQEISDKIFEGTRSPATGIVPPGIVGFQEDAWEYSKYDPEAAKEKLAEAGFPNGEGAPVVKIEFNSGSGHEDIMQLIQEDLKAIGLESELKGSEWAQYLDSLFEAKDYQFARLGWLADYPVMDNFLYPLFHSESADNYAFYNNPDVDAALEEARQITDEDERIEAYREVEKMVGEDMPVVPIMFYRHTRVGSDSLRNAVFSPMGLLNFDRLWIAAE